MIKEELKYYLKQVTHPFFWSGFVLGFVFVLIGAGFLFYNSSRNSNQITTNQPSQEQLQIGEASQVQNLSSPLKYQVARGDSTWKIAQELLGDGNKYVLIEQANNLVHNQWLEPDMELIIPGSQQSGQLPADSQVASDNQTNEVITYTVEPNDSLWFISLKYLGSGRSWVQIYQANKSTIGNNPNLIYPGQILKLSLASG